MGWELTEDERAAILSVLQATLLRDRSHTAYARGTSKQALAVHCARLEAAIVLLSTREPGARARARSALPAGDST